MSEPKTNSEDVFIGIVPSMGSRDVTWQGSFRFDKIEGYVGRLLSPQAGLGPGTHSIFDIFATPPDLDRDLLWCVLDGSRFGTVVWPRFGSQRHNVVGPSRIIEARFPTVVDGAHFSEEEESILKISLCSATLAPLFDLKAYEKTMQPSTGEITIKTTKNSLQYNSQTGSIAIGINHHFDSSRGSAGLDAEVILRVTLSKARSVKESVELLHQIETLVSLLCFDYIKASRFEFASVLSDGKERSLPVARAQFVEGKEEINWKKLPLVLRGGPGCLNNFSASISGASAGVRLPCGLAAR